MRFRNIFPYLFWGLIIAFLFFFPIARGSHIFGNYLGSTKAYPIVTPYSGVVENIYVIDGDHVNAGKLLVELTDPSILSRIQQLESKLFEHARLLEASESKISVQGELVNKSIGLRDSELISQLQHQVEINRLTDYVIENQRIKLDQKNTKDEVSALKTQLQIIKFYAPIDGQVYDIKTFQRGQFLPANSQIASILSFDQKPLIEARVPEALVHTIEKNLAVEIRFTSLPSRKAPLLFGKVLSISYGPNTRENQSREQTNDYIMLIQLDSPELNKLHEFRLVQGMPVEVLVKTGEQPLVFYMIDPLKALIWRAFKEQ